MSKYSPLGDARRRALLTQRELAERIGVKGDRYIRVEYGIVQPTADEQQRISDVVGVPVRKLWPAQKASAA
jgi:transcriptional regulator with XRE-family HTH domain